MTIDTSIVKEPSIALTGLSGRFPKSDNAEHLWDNLLNGRVLYEPDTFPYPKIFNKTPKSRGALKDTIHFDNTFFGYDNKSANFLDPQLRILLEVVYEALWDAGVPPEDWYGSRTGFYLGSSFEETGLTVRSLDSVEVGQHFSSRVSYHFNWKGPSMTVDTACASSLNALAEAYYGLINGTCDQAVVAGVCLHLKPNVTICFGELEMLSKSGKSRCLDSGADGYIRSEAVAAVVLQKEKQANRVYAKIIGVATSSDGYTKEGITYPCREVQTNTMKLALNRSHINPISVEYVEAHITGTSVGDPIETGAIMQAYRGSNTETPLIIGCLKGNIGHTEASAGLCATIKALKIFQNSIIPMNIGMENPNPRIDSLREGQLITPNKNLSWKGNIIAVDAFGFGGSNTHCIFDASNKRYPVDDKPRHSTRLICYCNRTERGLKKIFNSMQFRSNEYLSLVDKISIGTTLESGMKWRGFSVVEYNSDGIKVMDQKSNHSTHRLPIVMLFDAEMSNLAYFNSHYDPINDLLDRKVESCYDYLKKNGYQRKFLEEKPIIVKVIHQLAWADLLVNDLNIKPNLVIGYSFGSIAASFAAKKCSWNVCLSKLGDLIRLQKDPSNRSLNFRSQFEAQLAKMRLNDLVNHYKNLADSDTYIHLYKPINQIESIELVLLNISSLVTYKQLSTDLNYIECKDILVTLGNLYIFGSNPKIGIFNPQQLPVSSSCPSLGHLIEWNHEMTFDNVVYPDFFRDSFHTVHRIDLMDPDFSGLAGYSIEGEPICPISCYIWIIWDHLVKLRCADQRHRYHSFEIHNLKVQQLINLTEPVEFRVTSNPDTGEFAIKYAANYQPIATGFAQIVDNQTFDYSSYLKIDNESLTNEEPIILSSEDFYADLLIRGWTSEESFKNVTSFNSSQSQANIKFTGNWITFFESVLISPLILDSFDSIMALPVQLDWFRCDPLMLNETLKIQRKSGADTNNGLTFQLDVNSHMIGTKGLITRFPNYQQISNTTVHPELHYRHQIFLPLNNQLHSLAELNNNQLDLVERIDYFLSLLETTTNQRKNQIEFSLQDSESTLLQLISSLITLPDNISSKLLSDIDYAFEREMTSKNCGDLLHMHLGLFEENCPSNKLTNIHQVGRVDAYSYDSNCDLTFRRIRSNYTFKLDSEVNSDSLSSADLVIYNHSSLGLSFKEVNIEDEISFLSNFNSISPSSFLLILIREEKYSFEDTLCQLIAGVKSTNQISSKCLVDYLLQNDFVVISEHSINNGCPIKSILLRKVNPNNLTISEPRVIYISERNYDWVEKLKGSLDDSDDKIWLISNGSYRSGLIGLALSLKEESFGHRIRAILAVGFKHSKDGQIFQKLRTNDLLINVRQSPDGPWGSYRHIELNPYEYPTVRDESAYLTWKFEKISIESMESTDLPTLSWYRSPLTNEDTHVKVHYSTFNYLDKLIGCSKNLSSIPKDQRVGWEFSGYSTETQKRVMGICEGNGSTGSLTKDSIIFQFDVPNSWSLESAVTTPIPYSLAYYCLYILSSAKRFSNVFINGSLDGFEIAIISICLSLECNIFISLDSEILEQEIRRLFPSLSRQNFIHSNHDLDKYLLQSTSGSGIDIAINTGSYKILHFLPNCCSFGAKIIHIGSIDENCAYHISSQLVQKCGSLASFEPFDLFRNLLKDKDCLELRKKIFDLFKHGLQNKQINPLPAKIITRLNVITKGHEILKNWTSIERFVISIRDEVTTRPIPVRCFARTYFNPKKCYILIGGLGGIGLQLTRWMVNRGAKNIVITSRNGITNQYQRFIIGRLKRLQFNPNCDSLSKSSNLQSGVNIVVINTPTSDESSCAKVIKESIDNYGPIGGIFNLAGILKSGLLENQSPETFREVCFPKIEVTEHFDKLSRLYCPQLDYFVCFSSISALGILGEPNYGYANSYMERLCEERRSSGLPGSAIQLGAVGDIGMARHLVSGQTVSIAGSAGRRVLGVISDLDKFLQLPYSICYAVQHAVKQENIISGKTNILQRIGHILGCASLEKLDGNITLGALGLDSLQAIEVKNLIDTTYNLNLSNIAILKLTISSLDKLATDCNPMTLETGENQGNTSMKVEEPTLITLTEKGTEPIFFFPPAFFDFLSMMPVAEALNRTVIGVQLTENVRALGTFEKISKFYAETILSAYPNLTRYDFVGYSFGCTVSYELAKVLQSMIGKDKIDRIVFIDASPYGLKKLGQKIMKMVLSGYPTWEIFIATMQFMGVKIDEKTKMALEESEDDEFMYKEIVSQVLVQAGMNGPTDSLIENAAGLIDRAYYLGSMNNLGSFDGDALFVQVINKAVKSSGTISLVNEGLSKIIKGSLKTVMFNATHFDILKVYAREVAAEIEKIMP